MSGFSDLRTKFEQLSTSAGPSTPSHGPSSRPPSRLARKSSDPDSQMGATSEGEHSLRPASSASSLKSNASQTGKKPPPPPPSRRPAGSPLVQPALVLEQPQALSLETLITRKPPPIPAAHSEDVDDMPAATVSALRSKFASPSSRPKPNGTRIVSQPNTPSETPPPRPSRPSSVILANQHSVPIPGGKVSTTNPRASAAPRIQLQTPARDEPSPSSPTNPPPLPSRPRPTSANVVESPMLASPVPMTTSRSVPPPPPPRHHAALSPDTPVASAPPPLPVRRNTHSPAPGSDVEPPVRRATLPEQTSDVPPATRILPPPPKRMIGLSDKLPPVRHESDDEDEDDESESDSAGKDQLPDASRASRRPPGIRAHNYSAFRIHVPAHTGTVATSAHRVAVASNHHVKLYDLQRSDAPLHSVDLKDALAWKSKETKASAAEFRWSAGAAEACFLWVGTSAGHLVEIDVRSGAVCGTKAGAHAGAVTHMFRHGRGMVSLDESGKALVWSPSPEEFGEELVLAFAQPRVVRIADRQDWARLIAGRLWTSARGDAAPQSGGASRGPIVRVYDVFTPGSAGRSVLPTEHVGAVTSGAVVPSVPGRAFLGHEGGNISVWALDTPDGVPSCEHIVKVSVSDVLSLEGVNERLWMGGRKGMITAFEVTQRPWAVRNCWMAHDGLPVQTILVDPWSVAGLGRLAVVSVGRDEQLKYWDGLLGGEWIETELLKREAEFSTFRKLKALIVTYNIDAAKPESLSGSEDSMRFLEQVLTSVDRPDIISFGFQELIDLESRRMAAKQVFYSSKKHKSADGRLSEKVTKAYRRWYDHLVAAVRMHMPPEDPYTVIHSETMVGLFSCVFVKDSEHVALKDVALSSIKRGMGGHYGNKGGIVCRFVVDDTSICFVNCHLAAGQHQVRTRNRDVASLFDDKEMLPLASGSDEPVSYVNGGDGTMVLDHEIVFLNGDMNYRIDLRREVVINAVKTGDLDHLLQHDQLLKEMRYNRGFRLRQFSEGPIEFTPTYKYDRGSDAYDTSDKRRCPAWCDRVLWRSREPARVRQLHYRRWEADMSDHRPVSAAFEIMVKSVDQEARARVKGEVHGLWRHEEKKLLKAAEEYYVEQLLL